eukprot:CAMPEP_0197902992 /NCGR_PEP_ID=MMETSP1439-20131203/54851_1 /TAXON_ID=66791 /ORGANISM="Gonyaulax spinifera, Strain CCMP409" /LENGTH=436 /DNA_ID=CAMNT_0043524073 /DNA_START=62 /DNA_END=1372 /DNA_ORIENTATION=+
MPGLWSRVAGGLLALPGSLAAGSIAPGPLSTLPLPGGKYALNWVENISVPTHPGYAEMPPELNGELFVTSFEATPFVGKNALYHYDKKAGMQMLPGSDKMNWPNAVTGAAASVFGFPAVIVGSGFLVPSHTTGAIWVLEAAAEPHHLNGPVKVTKDKAGYKPDSGWFYHLAFLIDMNGDGKQDILTARCEYGVWPWSKKQGELIWLQQPDDQPLSGKPWEEHHLADGPDFLFCVQPGTKTLALAAPEYISKRIVYYFMHEGKLKSRILDEASGPGFSCSWEDLDGDGRLELLATNHVNENGSVYAYSFDGDDFSTAAITRHVLATGFNAATRSQGTASPGDAVAFRPSSNDKGRPHIFLSGDNSNSIFMLSPTSEEAGTWTYTTQQIAYLGADIGRPAIRDTDGDGFADIYVPAYDNNVLVHYSFRESSNLTQIMV